MAHFLNGRVGKYAVSAGVLLISSWGTYKLFSVSHSENLKSKKSTPSFLVSYKGLDKEDVNYKKDTLGFAISKGPDAYDFLTTGSENRDIWESMWKNINDNSSFQEVIKVDREYSSIKNKLDKVKSGFDENKNETSLNGLCESLYNKKNTHKNSMYANHFCWPGFLIRNRY